MARLSQDDNDKALWLTLAQSWVRLAEHVARHDLGDEQFAAASSELVSDQDSELAPDQDLELASEDELA